MVIYIGFASRTVDALLWGANTSPDRVTASIDLDSRLNMRVYTYVIHTYIEVRIILITCRRTLPKE